MNPFRRPALILACVLAAAPWSSGADPAAPALPAIPPGIAVPAGQVTALVLTAKGVQIYVCRALAGDATKFEWALQAPDADLFDAQGRKVGHHYGGPTWELADGGKVVGRLKAKADAPDGEGVPWLLVEAAENQGTGVMSQVRSIQRVATVGGKAPAEAAEQAKVGQERRVEYRATYVFSVAQR